MTKNTKLTLKTLLERKEQIINQKKTRATAELYVKSLDGTITIVAPDRAIIADSTEMGESDGTKGDMYVVYQCVTEPSLKSKELQEAYGCVEPLDIVEKLFLPGEISAIAKELLELAGYDQNGVKKISDEVKN